MERKIIIEDALSTLKDNGLKYTRKREELISYLVERNGYVSAKEIHAFMGKNFPGLSYDTVYRNLHDFSALGILEETELNGEMKFRIHCGHGNSEHHHHFICTTCGKTIEIKMCPMDFFKEQLTGCQIEGHRFEIFGTCENCKKKLDDAE